GPVAVADRLKGSHGGVGKKTSSPAEEAIMPAPRRGRRRLPPRPRAVAGYKPPDSEDRFERSRALALLAGLAAEAKSGMTAAEAKAFADQAVAALQDAVKAGWTRAEELKEPDFDALRKRDDFQRLVKELSLKAAAGDQPNPEMRAAPPG